ncbi:hypothetical protein [Streptomyces longwoodensis]|uniref:hypothetical protein n=1 Tax=Streptomyces longwoodensis TaxID=68231 RepID=UPI0033DBF4E0
MSTVPDPASDGTAPGPGPASPPSTPRPPGPPGGRLRRMLPGRARHRRRTTALRHLEHDLASCRQELQQWREHADSYARELGRAGHERAHLLAWLAALHPASAVLVRADATQPEDTHWLRLVAGGYLLTWRVAPAELALFAHVPSRTPAPDGAARPSEDSAARDARIRRHTRLLALEEVLHSVPTGPRPARWTTDP